MILLRDYNLLFIKARKVAGTSFEIALSKFASNEDIITPISSNDEKLRTEKGFTGPENFEYSNLELYKIGKLRFLSSRYNYKEKRKFYNHIPAEEIRKRLGPSYFDSLTKIGIVRNPFDSLVSLFYWVKHNGLINNISFQEFIKLKPDFINQNSRQILINDQFVLDEAIKYENFSRDIMAVEKKYALNGLYNSFSTINANSNTLPKNIDKKNLYADQNLVSTVYFLNENYIKQFGYEKKYLDI